MLMANITIHSSTISLFCSYFHLVTHNRRSEESLMQLNELRLAEVGSEKPDITQKQDINGQ